MIFGRCPAFTPTHSSPVMLWWWLDMSWLDMTWLLGNESLQVLLVWLDVSQWHGMTWVWLLWLSVVGVVHGMDWKVGLGVGGVVPCMWLVWLCLWDLGGS